MKDRSYDLKLFLQPKEKELLRKLVHSKSGWIGYGGARGGAKSHSIRAAAMWLAWTYPNLHILVFRRTFPLLWENHILKFFEEWPFMVRYWSKENKTFSLPNGSRIHCRYADTLKDVLDFKGKEYIVLFIDEATDETEDEIRILTSCCRSTSTAITPKRVLTFNPGGVGHNFVRRLFIDRKHTKEEAAQGIEFIQANPWDNAMWVHAKLLAEGLTEEDYWSWTEKERIDYFLDTDYGRELMSNTKYRDAWLWSRWDIQAGAYFDIWDKELHTVSHEDIKPEKHWRWWIGIDWGFVHPTAVGWGCTDGSIIYTYKEWVQKGLTPVQIAEGIVEGSRGIKIDSVFLSPDAFAQRTSERTIAIEMGEVLRSRGLPAPEEADNDRIGGWQLMYELMRDGKWKISRECEQTIYQIPMMQRNPETKNFNQQEDCLKVDGDDAADMNRYLLKTRMRGIQLTPDMRAKEEWKKIAHVTSPEQDAAISPTMRAILGEKLAQKMREMKGPMGYLRRNHLTNRQAR